MGKHSKHGAPVPKSEPRGDTPRGSGRGWLTPEQVDAAQKAIDDTNQKNVRDAAKQIQTQRYHHDR